MHNLHSWVYQVLMNHVFLNLFILTGYAYPVKINKYKNKVKIKNKLFSSNFIYQSWHFNQYTVHELTQNQQIVLLTYFHRVRNKY